MTHGGQAIAKALGALGKESPLYGMLAGDRDPVVQGQKLLSLSSLQGLQQHWREAVLAPFGVQQNFFGAQGGEGGFASKLPGSGGGGALGGIPKSEMGRAARKAPPMTTPHRDPAPSPHLKGSLSPQRNLCCLHRPLHAGVPATLIKGPSPRLGCSTAHRLLAPQNE